ncbi:TetR family transcriptional regulator C-terminal domain-containing protein [Streptomyces sp. AV19]|uniref:TetR/AcrR family transcriptional regulator n=1 Tax=Streptomyces sp. AV19 TaxID=2793068 RepID=UPI0018FEC4CC|nr:TetR family transcriptional regulator C-terminal domain-containing protein [Streptomyces sp. AV19]MBH1937721.1 TetR family transcriptional regulator C-terminal domain-containing protein [Streptomyces sp. AV19]MDG4536389.1 TetR family transcriptional regulator C-terminal domain-containing protein [Streptomyces sp. AV19]
MPKIVDHEERRHRLAEAVWTLTLRDGLESVTLRKVAAQAGVSMGQVQHYYSTREDMVRDAIHRAVRALDARIEASAEATGSTSAETILRACLRAMLARDPESLRLLRLSVAVIGKAISDPALAHVLGPGDDDLKDFTAGLITTARQERGTPPRGDDRVDADICWTVATGLGVDVALGQRSPDEALSVLDYHLDNLLG